MLSALGNNIIKFEIKNVLQVTVCEMNYQDQW